MLNNKKRVYLWEEFDVNVEFAYLKQLQGRAFMEIVDDSKSKVMAAKHYMEGNLNIRDFIATPFDELLKEKE